MFFYFSIGAINNDTYQSMNTNDIFKYLKTMERKHPKHRARYSHTAWLHSTIPDPIQNRMIDRYFNIYKHNAHAHVRFFLVVVVTAKNYFTLSLCLATSVNIWILINYVRCWSLTSACASVSFSFRIETLTQLPREIVEGAESLQVSTKKLLIKES